MSLELLNSDTHATVRMHLGEAMADPLVRIVTSEIAAAAAACPLFFSKHAESGAFYVGALTGFRRGEPMIDSPDGRWAFRPFEIDRLGFFASGDSIALDPDHPRFAVGGSEALFHPDQTPTAALRAVQKAIGGLMAGAAATDAFIAAMLAHRLIEPVDISLSFDDGETLRLDGLYTVSLDALSELPDAAVMGLFRAGHLQPAFALAGSLHHVALMARRRNARLTQIG
ncbi:MAG: SapC-like protein [Sphingobium sp.]|uniref:SapC family protein n=1 Tax=Sphingobium soli TaxID=1591116 RepID=A0ABS8H406_9SPHN|nr:SapC family protein [Sphingobium soli]MAX15505.1 SapC-like protein [Sphingobium sp.]MCC4233265.1 SapC family protein [Sphingobium soli]